MKYKEYFENCSISRIINFFNLMFSNFRNTLFYWVNDNRLSHLDIRSSGNSSSQKVSHLYEGVGSIPKSPKYICV